MAPETRYHTEASITTTVAVPGERPRPSERALPAYDQLIGPTPGAPSGRDRTRRRLLVLADAVGWLAAYACARVTVTNLADGDEALVVLVCLPVWVAVLRSLGLYDRDLHLIHSGTLDELPRIALAMFITVALIFIAAPPLAGIELDRGRAVVFMGFGIVLVATLRGIARWVVRRRHEPERCLIVGSGAVARLLAQKIAGHPEYGVKLVGFVDVTHEEPGEATADRRSEDAGQCRWAHDGAARLGDHASFAAVCRDFGVERVVIAFTSLGHEDLLAMMAASRSLELKVSVVPRLFEAMGHFVEVDQVEGMTLLGVRGASRSRSAVRLKRALDVALAGLILLVLGLPLAVIALAIKLGSPGPVFFTQQRIGRDNRPFRMFKFRTMVDDADRLKAELRHLNEADGPMFKIAEDPRLTGIGRRLRRSSVDELPQLWNVLRGEMSLVGPRPLVPSEDHHVIGHHRDRLRLAPGLTGPWQVLGRTSIPFAEMVKLDYLYVAEWSLWTDVKLILRTVPVVLQARGS